MAKLDGRLKNDLDTFMRTDLLPHICILFDEANADEIFVKMGLLTLQIYQVIQGSQDDVQARKKMDLHVIKIVSKAVDSIQKGIQFERCLSIFQTAFNLLDDETVLAVMKKRDHIILRELFAKLAGRNNLKPQETSAVYQLLISYASTENGATHLKEIHILDEL
jgi:hypothetical protein